MRHIAEQFPLFRNVPVDNVPVDNVNGAVIAKLKQRAQRGYLKYGVTMDREDLSELDWLQHAQDELLDGAVYLEKLIQLRRNP